MNTPITRPVACIDGSHPPCHQRLGWLEAACGPADELPDASAWTRDAARTARLARELHAAWPAAAWAEAVAAVPRPDDALIAFLNLPEDVRARFEAAGVVADVAALAACSPTYARFVRQVPAALTAAEGVIEECSERLRRVIDEARDDAEEVMECLRLRKRVRFVSIVLRELRSPQRVAEHAVAISAAADEALASALAWAVAMERAESDRICVFGMGKLGTRELNLSSDVDVVFVHDPVEAGDRERCARVVRRVVDVMERATSLGLVFRVDLRLRPFGSQGAASHTVRQLAEYLETHGRAWERGAWLKARVVAGNQAVGARALAEIEPFRFPRSLGAAQLQEIAALKHRMVDAARARATSGGAAQSDLKLEPGGIRHVEFFAQSFQLVFGSRDSELRAGATPAVLGKLVARGYVGERVANALQRAWTWLRAAEHRVQMVEERPTHALPLEGSAASDAADRLGYQSAEALRVALESVRGRVIAETASLFAQADEAPATWVRLAVGGATDEAEGVARSLGFDDPRSLVRAVQRLAEPPLPVLGSRASHADAKVAYALLEACSDAGLPGRAARGALDVLARREARDVLFPILRDRPAAARVLTLWFAAAPRLTQWVLRQPRVLADVLSPSPLVMQEGSPREALFERVSRANPVGDQHPVGAKLHALARAKLDAEASLVLARLGDAVAPRRLTQRASAVAAAVLDVVVALAFEGLGARRGNAKRERFGILALGKLGAGELAPGGDVDLVFVYDDASEHVRDYARVAQRVVSTLSSTTPFGQLYPADLRLRPDGGQGTVVTTLEGFSAYYDERAWPFERVAVGRASPVACAPALEETVRERIRAASLVSASMGAASVQEVRRRRIAEASRDDWKRCQGGLQDMELALQVVTLAERPIRGPQANTWSIIDALASELGDDRADRWRRAIDVFRDVELWSRLSEGAEVSTFPADLAARDAVEARVAAAAMRPFADAWEDARVACHEALAMAGLDGV